MNQHAVEQMPTEDADDRLPPVMKVDEVAAFLRVDRKVVYEMVERGEIACARLGRSIRIPRFAVLRLVSGETKKTRGR